MEKPKIKYRVVAGSNPSTGIAVYRPVVTERTTYYVDQVVEYALNSGYVRGQFQDMKGALNGFLAAVQSLAKQGFAVNLANWLRVHATITGSCDPQGTLTDANELKVSITALNDLKMKRSEFTCENVNTPANLVKVDGIASVGSAENWVIEKLKGFNVSGKNLSYDATALDTVGVTYDGLSTPISLTPTGSSYNSMTFNWPTALAELDDGTPLTFIFTLHAGAETPQIVEKVAIFKA